MSKQNIINNSALKYISVSCNILIRRSEIYLKLDSSPKNPKS